MELSFRHRQPSAPLGHFRVGAYRPPSHVYSRNGGHTADGADLLGAAVVRGRA